MNAAEVMTTLRSEGVQLRVKEGRLCVRPSVRDRPALMALVKSHAAELRQLLGEAERGAFEERAAIMEFDGGLIREEAERLAGIAASEPQGRIRSHWRGEVLDLGDLRPCLWCRNLTRSGRCLAAWRGDLRASRDWEPTFPGQPSRCIGYLPSHDDPDQRPGHVRWPELMASQARQHPEAAGSAVTKSMLRSEVV